MNTQYDHIIKQCADDLLPGVDWRLVKSQLWQESHLDPSAVSPAGAQGIAQIMPATWNDIAAQLNLPPEASPFDPETGIFACCHYMARLFEQWTAPRPDADRYALTLASYNAGLGNILDAQKAAEGANEYSRIIASLPKITGRDNAWETYHYVHNILFSFIKQVTTGDIT